MPQLILTQNALAKLANAQQTGVQVKLSQFELTNSADATLEIKGNNLYKGGISSISNENATTLRVKCLMPAGLAINDVVQKCYLYDEQGDVFAYGPINSFKYTQDANIEAEINIYLTFSDSDMASVSLIVPSDSFVDFKTFNEHQHDERYVNKVQYHGDIQTFARRYVTEIDLSDLPFDMMYPVPFCGGGYPARTEVQIFREGHWNSQSDLDGDKVSGDPSVSAVNICFTLSSYPWGVPQLMLKLVNNIQVYRNVVSDISWKLLLKTEKLDENGNDTAHNTPTRYINGDGFNKNYNSSGFYLRGGLMYHIICNQSIEFNVHTKPYIVRESSNATSNVRWTALPIPVAEANFGNTNYDGREGVYL
ncbi:hypothetical protein [Fastidiosibacter lacustris]|uniref:hypothetical protein n=1 Tax=Fastidiosibacter lacustris TaxID=2056695 RepID=UPI000E34CAA0|nr:hypothetical protein [Fastidiosibacter lacustris]